MHSRGYLQIHNKGYLQIHSRGYLHILLRIYLQIHGRIFTDTGYSRKLLSWSAPVLFIPVSETSSTILMIWISDCTRNVREWQDCSDGGWSYKCILRVEGTLAIHMAHETYSFNKIIFSWEIAFLIVWDLCYLFIYFGTTTICTVVYKRNTKTGRLLSLFLLATQPQTCLHFWLV